MSNFRQIEEAAEAAPPGEFAVDALGLAFGRHALAEAAAAAARANHHHARALDEAARAARYRRALVDAIDASRRIIAEAELGPAARPAAVLAEAAELVIRGLPPAPRRGRGSPGRVVQAAATEAAASVWSARTGRVVPRSGKVAAEHPLTALLRAIGADLFDSPGALSVSLLRPKK